MDYQLRTKRAKRNFSFVPQNLVYFFFFFLSNRILFPVRFSIIQISPFPLLSLTFFLPAFSPLVHLLNTAFNSTSCPTLGQQGHSPTRLGSVFSGMLCKFQTIILERHPCLAWPMAKMSILYLVTGMADSDIAYMLAHISHAESPTRSPSSQKYRQTHCA